MGVLLRDLFSRNGARHAVVCRVDSVDLARKRFAKHHAEQHTVPDTKSTDNAHDRFKAPVASEVNDNVPTSAHLALCSAQHPQFQGSNSSLSSCPSSGQGTTNRIDYPCDHPNAMPCCPSEPQLPLPQPAAATQADSTTQTATPPARARQMAVLPDLARVLSDVDIGRPSVAHDSSDRSESPRLDLTSRPDSLILAKTRWAKAGLEAKAQGRSRSERQSCTNGGHSSARASIDHPGPAALRSKSSMAERAAALLPLALLSSRHSVELDRHHPGEIRGRRSSGVSRGASPTRPGHLLTSSGSQGTGPAGRLAHATSLPATILTRDTSPPSAHARPGVLERLKSLLLSGPSDQSAMQPRHRTNTHGADTSQHTLPSARQWLPSRRGDSTIDRDPAAVASSLQGCSTYEAEGPRDSSHALSEEFNAESGTTTSPCAVFTNLQKERTLALAHS